MGSYEALNGGYMEEGIVMLTGARPDRLRLNNWQEEIGAVVLKKDKLWEKLLMYCNHNVMMGCSISNGKEERNETKGLVAGHAYAILDVKETKDKKNRLIKIRVRFRMLLLKLFNKQIYSYSYFPMLESMGCIRVEG